MMVKRLLPPILCVLALSPWAIAAADNSTRVGGYTIHHSAFPATSLDAEVAKAHDLQRSKRLGVLNVTVLKEPGDAVPVSVPAIVDVEIPRDAGDPVRVPMREASEQDAIYYLGQFPIQDQETLEFRISVRPQGETETLTVQMDQAFFLD